MNRKELLKKFEVHKANLTSLGVKELIISRECSLENAIDSTIPVIVEVQEDTYESYNKISEYLIRNIYEYIEVIPSDSFEIGLDEHFREGAIKIKF